MKMYLPCAGGSPPLSIVKCILTEDDCNLSRVKTSSSLVPRKKDTFGSQSHYGFGQVEYGEILKIYPT